MSRSAPEGGDAVSLRDALQSIVKRRDAYQAKKAQLEEEWKRELDEHAAGTRRLVQEWGRLDVDGFNMSVLDGEILARNARARQMENSASYEQAANLRNFERDLDAILRGVVMEDDRMSETSDVSRHADDMVVDVTAVQRTPSSEILPAREASVRNAQKRAREPDSPHVDTDKESPGPRKSRRISGGFSKGSTGKAAKPRTITFDEVYQGGNAQHKHAIFMCSFGSPGKWYIVKCDTDDHTVHFGGLQSALAGAAKHLSGKSHGMMSKSHKNALEQLGWEVLGCDKNKAAANNAALDDALSKGYMPTNTLYRIYRKPVVGIGGNFGRGTGSASPSRRPTSSMGTAITQAKGGELYYAWWPSDSMYYLSLIIPWDGTGFGLPELHRGIEGLGLFDRKQARLPKCYTVDNESRPRAITGWSEGYEDGGPNEAKRQFPILFFHPPKNLGAWVPASALEPFDWRDPKFGVPGYHLVPESVDLALAAFARSKGFPCFRDFRASQTTADTPVIPAIEAETVEEFEIESPAENVAAPSAAQVNEDATDPSRLTDIPTPTSGPMEASAPDLASKQLPSGTPSPAESGTGSVPKVPSPLGAAPLTPRTETNSPPKSNGPAKPQTAIRSRSGLPPRPPPRVTGPSAAAGPLRTPAGTRTPSVNSPKPQPRVNGPATSSHTPADTGRPVANPSGEQAGPPAQPGRVANPPAAFNTPARTGPSTAPAAIVHPSADTGRPVVNPSGQAVPPAQPGRIANPPTVLDTPARTGPSTAPATIAHPSPAGTGRPVVNSSEQAGPPAQPGRVVNSPAALNTPARTEPSTAPATIVHPSADTGRPVVNPSGQAIPPAQPGRIANPPTVLDTPARTGSSTAPATIVHPSADTGRPVVNPSGQAVPPAQPGRIANPPAALNTPARTGPSTAPAVKDTTSQARGSPRPTPAAKPPATHDPVRTQPPPVSTAAADPPPSTLATPGQTGSALVKTQSNIDRRPLSYIPQTLESPSAPKSPLVKRGSVQQFYLFKYEGTGGSWTAASDSERLVLEIDAESRTARSRPNQPVSFVIDPKRIVGHSSSRNEPEPGKHTLTLTVEGEPADKQLLVFDKYDGVTASRQARQFWTWANSG